MKFESLTFIKIMKECNMVVCVGVERLKSEKLKRKKDG